MKIQIYTKNIVEFFYEPETKEISCMVIANIDGAGTVANLKGKVEK